MKKSLFLFFCLGCFVSLLSAQEIVTVPKHANGIYQLNEPISWEVSATGENAGALTQVSYTIKQFGKTVLKEGTLDLSKGPATLETVLTEPSTVLVDFTAKAGDKEIKHAAGAVAAPEGIKAAAERPADFDAFWEQKIADLRKIPMNPVVETADSENPDVEYYKVTLDNINGSKVWGQLAKPKKEGKFPALLLVQYAGVYGLPKGNVTGRAAQGFLTFNIMAHDLPFDKPPEFYKAQADKELKGYTAFGKDDRETSYFLRMYLGCYRAADYLTSRGCWDGRTFLVAGDSQGGQQALITGGLHPKVTGILANVPAGCDAAGPLHGRGMSYPYWAGWSGTPDEKAIQVGRYFDSINFASRIKAPALVGLGLIDTTCYPAGVLSATNQIPGKKEVIIMVDSEHKNKKDSQKPFYDRREVWLNAAAKGEALPP